MVQAVAEGICRYEGHTLLVATLNTKLVLFLTGGRRIYRSSRRSRESGSLAVCGGINCVFVFVEITSPVNRQVSHRTNQLAGYNEAISNVTVQSLTLFS